MNGYVEHIPMMYHPGLQRNGGPYGYEYGSGEFIAPLTAGLIVAGLGFIGGGLLAGRPPGVWLWSRAVLWSGIRVWTGILSIWRIWTLRILLKYSSKKRRVLAIILQHLFC